MTEPGAAAGTATGTATGTAAGTAADRAAKEAVAREAEERRLFFVGVTRAQRRLFLSAARQTARHPDAALSPFLAVLDEGLLERTGEALLRRPKPRQLRLV